MPSRLPLGDPAPAHGMLPASAGRGARSRDFGVYVHVPFCRVRCGYCDFNTYTSADLAGSGRVGYAAQAIGEMALAARVMSGVAERPVSTVFFGGGTPTLLPAADLAGMLQAIEGTWGLAPAAEVTTEANPDSVDAATLLALREAGFTRVSFGMQSAQAHVLATLERTHDPRRIPAVVRWARDAGLQVSLDVIYGTPGETLDDWRRTVDAVLAQEPDHISAYALIVEDGTKLAAQIRRGAVAPVDDDLQAAQYELADAAFAGAGYDWYEVSNWARDPSLRSRHNLAYWLGHDWWGIGPGAHSHVGGVRWWNVKHPYAYADRIAAGVSPAAAREVLDEAQRRTERVLLRTRIRAGLDVAELGASHAIAGLIADGLIDGREALAGTVVPTLRGRLLADAVVRALT